MNETLETAAAAPSPEVKPVVETPKTETKSMSGPSVEATFDLSKKPEAKLETAESPVETPETPEAAASRVAQQETAAKGALDGFDKKAATTGKPLDNSEFLDRANLVETSVNAQLTAAETKPDAEKKVVVEKAKEQVEQNMQETAKRFVGALGDENKDLAMISTQRLIEGLARQIKQRGKLEGAGLAKADGASPEAKALVQESVAPEAAKDKDAATKNVEKILVQLRPEGTTKEELTGFDKADPEMRQALLQMTEIAAMILAEHRKGGVEGGKKDGVFDTMLGNLRKLEGATTAKVEGDAKGDIKELLGITPQAEKEKTQEELTASALEKFTENMKQGEAKGMFGKLMDKIGQFAIVKKMKEFFVKTFGKDSKEAQALTKLGDKEAVDRLQGVLVKEFGPLDLTKKVEAPKKDLKTVNEQLASLDKRMEAYDAANGSKDTLERRALMGEYAPLRAEFDQLSGTAEAAPAAAIETPATTTPAPEAAPAAETPAPKAPEVVADTAPKTTTDKPGGGYEATVKI